MRDGVFDARLFDQHRLEAPFQGRIFFHVLAVFIDGRRADHVQFAARQHGFEHVAGVHGAFGRAGADHGVHFINEQDDFAGGVGNLLQDRLQALFEFAAVFGARPPGRPYPAAPGACS